MSKANTELFIARRIASSKGGESKGVMVRIAIATTAVSMAVMIIAVAVIMGFRKEISDKIIGFSGHLRISALDYSFSTESAPIKLNRALEEDIASIDGFRRIAPFALKGGLVKTDDATQGVVLKGVDGSYDWSFFEANMVEGALPRVGDSVRHKDILVSLSTARIMKIGVDDRVEMLFVHGDRPPRRDRFRVSGIYSSGLEEMDKVTILTEIANVQRLYGWSPEQVTGYEIFIDDIDRLEKFEQEAYVRTLQHDDSEPPLMIRTIYGDNQQMFDWLKTHDVNAAVIITIMLVVAFFSLISALLIILLERTSMIGILKALGMTNRSVRKIFIARSAYILAAGLLIGNAVGVGLALLQKYTALFKLDESGYFLASVPIDLGWEWIAGLNVGTIVIILALLIVPTNIVSRITPEKTIRYQ